MEDPRAEEYMLLMLFMSMGMTEDQLEIIHKIYTKKN